MERPSDELVKRLLAAADARAGLDLETLIAEAINEAQEEVRNLLRSAMTAAMLRRAVAGLEAEPGARKSAQAERAVTGASTPDKRIGPPPDADLACYLYCISRRSSAEVWDDNDLLGVDSAHPVFPVSSGALAVVVSDVSPGMFDEAAIAERIKDLEWVGQKVRAHDFVVKRAMEMGPVIPLRFGMVLRSQPDVVALLERHRGELTKALNRLEGKREWGVKVYLRPEMLSQREGDRSPGRSSERGAGTTYLLERTRSDQVKAEMRETVRAYAQDCHERLAAHADSAVELSLRNPAPGADAERDSASTLISNGAYLVEDAQSAAFAAAVESLAARFAPEGLDLEVTGPWPPYNFVGLDLSRDLSAAGGER